MIVYRPTHPPEGIEYEKFNELIAGAKIASSTYVAPNVSAKHVLAIPRNTEELVKVGLVGSRYRYKLCPFNYCMCRLNAIEDPLKRYKW